MKQDTETFNHRNVAKFFIVYELKAWLKYLNTDILLDDWLFGAAKLTKNADLDKYGYSGYGIGFDAGSDF